MPKSIFQRAQQMGPVNQGAMGLLEPGTITNIYNRPATYNAPMDPTSSAREEVPSASAPWGQGGYSTTYSMSFQDPQGRQVLVPTVVNGQFLSDNEARDRYYQTGQHLGIFDTPENADRYATQLHNSQAAMGGFYGSPQNRYAAMYGGMRGKR